MLWPDGPPASAAKVIQGCVVRLRGLLGSDAIVTSEQGYRLDGVVEIDVVRFEEGLALGREYLALGQHDRAAHKLSQVLDLWRGTPYPDLEDWDAATIEMVRLGELLLQAEELHTDALLGRGDHDQALVTSRGLVLPSPCASAVGCSWRWRSTARVNRPRHWPRCVELGRTSARISGWSVGAEASTLEQAILHQDPTLLSPATQPTSSTRCPWPGLSSYDAIDADFFFGREGDLVSALAILRSRPVLVVVGPSGIGKSSFVRAGIGAAFARDGRSVEVTSPTSGSSGPARVDVLIVDQSRNSSRCRRRRSRRTSTGWSSRPPTDCSYSPCAPTG